MTRKPDTDEGRDPERTPMQWDASPNAGFSPAGVETWLPVNPDYQQVNVAREELDPKSTLNFYRRLLALRKSEPALLDGEFTFIETPAEDVLAYTRIADGKGFLVAINFSDGLRQIDLPNNLWGGEIVLSTLPGGSKPDPAGLSLRPHEGLLVKIK